MDELNNDYTCVVGRTRLEGLSWRKPIWFLRIDTDFVAHDQSGK